MRECLAQRQADLMSNMVPLAQKSYQSDILLLLSLWDNGSWWLFQALWACPSPGMLMDTTSSL